MITTVCKISYGSQTVPPIVPAVQGDTGRAISFEIADFTPPAGATATYFILKPSGEAIYNSATITNNSILCELTAQSLAEAGENRMQVRVLLGEDIVTSFEVILMVRTFLGDDAIESGTEMNIFDQAVEQATEQFQENAEQIVEEVIESIPADYTELTEEVDELNERLDNEITDVDEIIDSLSDQEYISMPVVRNSGYIISTSDGNVTSAGAANYVSSPIDVEGKTKLYLSGCANYSNYIYAFYTANNEFISGKKSASGSDSTGITDEETRVPTGAKYLVLSNRNNVAPFMACKYINYSVKGMEVLEGKVDEITGTEQHLIDFLADTTYQTGYYSKTGAYTESSSYVCSSKIPVIPGDIVTLIFAISGNPSGFRFVTAYADDSAIFAKGAENTGTGGYTVPDGINYIRVSISGQNTQSSAYNIHIKRNISETTLTAQVETDNLFEKKWCVVGDSFSYGGQTPMPVFADGWYKGARKSYPYFIGNRTHINIVDFTANGKTLAYPADGSFSNSLTNPNATQYYQNIPSDVDYITIYLGINDSHHAPGSSGGDGEDNTGEIPIGTIDDASTATFGGAWNVVLSWLIANRPNAHIGIIVSNGVDNINYRNMTIAIAKKYGLAYLDLNGDERTPAMIRPQNNDIPSSVKTALITKWAVDPATNTHPNTDAHEFESFFIENFLRSI